MSFNINGITWTPQTAAQHASNVLTTLNATLQSEGLATLVPTQANALWQVILACCSEQQSEDQNIQSAFSSFNIATCSDQQVLNLLPVIGTSLIPATYSTVVLQFTATPGGTLVVPAGTVASYQSGISFTTNTTLTVPASSTGTVLATCSVSGPVNVASNNITSITTSPANYQSVTNPNPAVPGQAQETITSCRTRIINGFGTINWTLNGTILAIREIAGIQYANIYFNYSSSATLTLTGGIVLQPRVAYIVIYGSDPTGSAIANAWSTRQTSSTYNNGGTAPYQNFTSASGQTIPIYYDNATISQVYVKVYYDPNQPTQSGFESAIKNAIININSNVNIGQEITSTIILNALQNFTYATITGASVSLDNITFTRAVSINANSIGQFTAANVSAVSGP